MDDFSGMWQIRGPGHQGIHKVVAGRGAKLKAQFQNEEMKLLENGLMPLPLESKPLFSMVCPHGNCEPTQDDDSDGHGEPFYFHLKKQKGT